MPVTERIIICLRADAGNPGGFDDQRYDGVCVDCAAALQYRPHSGPGPKICIQCFARKTAGQDVSVHLTEATLEDLRRMGNL